MIPYISVSFRLSVDGVVSLVEALNSNRFFSAVFNVGRVFSEAGVKGASTFTDVELGASGGMNG